jgi:hypothetical protein
MRRKERKDRWKINEKGDERKNRVREQRIKSGRKSEIQ